MQRRSFSCFAALGLLLPVVCHAQLIAYEGFNYTAGSDLDGANGGTGWSGDWAGSLPNSFQTAQSSSLAYAPLGTSAGSVSFGPTAPASGLTFTRSLANPLASTSGTVFFSFLMSTTTPGPYEMLFDLRNGVGSEVVSLGVFYANTAYFQVARFLSTGILGSSDQTAHLYVLQLELGGGTSANTSRVSVYFDPFVNAAQPYAPTVTLDNLSLFDVHSVGLTARGGTILLDELRVGSAWTDVVTTNIPGSSPVPEPSTTAALVGLAGLWAASTRRRRILLRA